MPQSCEIENRVTLTSLKSAKIWPDKFFEEMSNPPPENLIQRTTFDDKLGITMICYTSVDDKDTPLFWQN